MENQLKSKKGKRALLIAGIVAVVLGVATQYADNTTLNISIGLIIALAGAIMIVLGIIGLRNVDNYNDEVIARLVGDGKKESHERKMTEYDMAKFRALSEMGLVTDEVLNAKEKQNIGL